MILDASPMELVLVAMILVLVLIAPKVPRVGERLGALFGTPPSVRPPERRPPA